MERKKASDFPPEVLTLFDDYVHGTMNRREFLDRASRYAVGGFTALAMLEALSPNYALAQQVPKDDRRIKTGYVEYDSPRGSGKIRAYMAHPATGDRHPGVALIHENRGLSPYNEDVARRLALQGYLVIAPDALSPVGGYPGNDEEGAKAFAKLDPAKRNEDLITAFEAVGKRPESNGRVGALGFCIGGEIVGKMAVRYPTLAAAAMFYPTGTPNAADTAKIKAPLLVMLGEKDERFTPAWLASESALKAAGVRYQRRVYENAQHAFHNETGPRYNEAAAKDAWSRTLDFFELHLKG